MQGGETSKTSLERFLLSTILFFSGIPSGILHGIRSEKGVDTFEK